MTPARLPAARPPSGAATAAASGARARARIAECAALLWGVTLAAGCRSPEAPAAADVARDEQVRGPLRLTVTAAPRRPLVGDRVTVTIAFEAPEGYRAALPGPDALAPLTAEAGEAIDERPAAAGRVWRRTFTVEPLAAGSLEIPALTVRYVPPQAAGAAAAATQPTYELVSGALRLEVRSALSEDDRPTQPRDITGPIVPPAPPWPWWAWALLASGAAVGSSAVAGLTYWLRRRAARPPPPLSPEEWALRELERLTEHDWLGRGAARELYYRVTAIVRQYVERKYALAAPEMTTEEFLATLDRRPLPLDADRLRAFLEACDLVKYAALEPGPADIARTLGAARAFVTAGTGRVRQGAGPGAPVGTGGDEPTSVGAGEGGAAGGSVTARSVGGPP